MNQAPTNKSSPCINQSHFDNNFFMKPSKVGLMNQTPTNKLGPYKRNQDPTR